MNIQKVALCSIQKQALRDGNAGPNAKINLPFVGLYFADGGEFTDPTSTQPQFQGYSTGANWKPQRFVKTPGVCA